MAICLSRMTPGFWPVVSMTRPALSGMVAFSAVVGYVAAPGQHFWPVALFLLSGIALLSAAASILNQVQEVKIDACMVRTQSRPLVDGSISVGDALLLAVGCGVAGSILLAAVALTTALAGLFALMLYNGCYTPLKQSSSFALFPGALSGALPVAAGWLAASGPLLDPRLWSLLIFMVLWQVPHFICIAIRDRSDYSRAGLALVPASVTAVQLVYLTRLWSVALAVGALQLVTVGLYQGKGGGCAGVTVAVTLWFVFSTWIPFRIPHPEAFALSQGRRLKLLLLLLFVMMPVASVLH